MMEDLSTGSQPSFDVVAGVIVKDGRYLITRRHDESHQGGLWEFPGGKREENETLIECLEREIKEELDLDVEVGPLIKRTRHAYALCTMTLHFFRCTIRSGTPRAIGCQDFEWVEPAELVHYPFPQANVPILQELVKSSYHQDAIT
jgi:mutator protein MutT